MKRSSSSFSTRNAGKCVGGDRVHGTGFRHSTDRGSKMGDGTDSGNSTDGGRESGKYNVAFVDSALQSETATAVCITMHMLLLLVCAACIMHHASVNPLHKEAESKKNGPITVVLWLQAVNSACHTVVWPLKNLREQCSNHCLHLHCV